MKNKNNMSKKIENAKKVLKDAGYYVDNLWHINDVKQNYKVSDDEAYKILDVALTSDWITERTFEMINDVRIDLINSIDEQ
jgi:hypothetical protein